jgi:Pyruvate/2-oxoacid:ferredoxin oxidoreductase delta subunit
VGHLGHLKQEYQALIRRLDAGQVGLPEAADPAAQSARRELLEILYTPEDAALAAQMPVVPATLEEVSARVGIDPIGLKPRLDAMCDRGLVMDMVHPETGDTWYVLSPPVVGFFEFSMMRTGDETLPKKRVAEALEAYAHDDPTFAREVFGLETVIGRALVQEGELACEVLPDVLDWERATSVVREARAVSVSNCYCRHKAEHLGKACDIPQEICLSLNAGADFVARRKLGRAIDNAQAMAILLSAREAGLVQIADNVRNRPTYICNCCACCCGQLQAINEWDLHAVNPSGFVPRHDDRDCKGCSRCSRACPVTAISMRGQRVESRRRNDLEPHFDLDRCIGCGVCAGVGKQKAISMVRRDTTPYVPDNSLERSIRMALEHGRLADLVFDYGAGRGHRFMNRVLRTITELPPARQLLASELLRSRFLRAAITKLPDITA